MFRRGDAAYLLHGTHMHISVAQNTERGKSEERPALSIFHCGRIKGEKTLGKKTWPVFPFCSHSKNKTHFKWETFGFSCHVGFDFKTIY